MPHLATPTAAVFAPDGRSFLTSCGPRLVPDGPDTVWLTPLPIEEPTERITLWAQLITGMELDAGGGFHDLSPEAWRQRYQQLQSLAGQDR